MKIENKRRSAFRVARRVNSGTKWNERGDYRI